MNRQGRAADPLAEADVPAFLEAAVARGDGVDTKVMLLYRG